MLTRLTNIGFIEPNEPLAPTEEIPREIERRARLVYTGDFESMDGPVTVSEAQLVKLAEGYNSRLAKLVRMTVGGAIPVGLLPPLQLDHKRESSVTIGRLSNKNLTIEDWKDEDGVVRKALYGMIRISGRENVEKTLDGRYSTLSIGADFENPHIEEVSVTPFPAAKHAMAMSRRRMSRGERVYHDDSDGLVSEVFLNTANGKYEAVLDGKSLDLFLTTDSAIEALKKAAEEILKKRPTKLSEGDDMKLNAFTRKRLSRYFQLRKKMTEEEAETELKKLEKEEDEEKLKKLADEVEEDEKKEEEEKKKKLSAANDDVKRLATDFTAKRDAVKLAARTAWVGNRLSAIRSSGKITPAEIKKINLTELSAKSDEAVEAVLKSYEDRQPVIFIGQIGSLKALSGLKKISEDKKSRELAELEARSRANMSLKRAEASNKRLAEGEKEVEKGEEKGAEDSVSIHIDTDPHTDLAETQTTYDELCNMMDSGKIEEAKEKLKKMMESMKRLGSSYVIPEPTMHETSMTYLAAMQKDIDSLSKQFDDAMDVVKRFVSGE